MGFVNVSLLFGGALAAIPVVLHLVLRQQPKRVVFPAVRFLKERRESNRRELQLRHWLLLLLRCAVIGIGALALARPSVASAVMGNWAIAGGLFLFAGLAAFLAAMAKVRSAGKWLIIAFAAVAIASFLASGVLALGTLGGSNRLLTGDRQAPVAAAMVIDTSTRMAYRFRNQSRLELAQETGLWLLKQLPADSQVAVLESRPGPPFFAVDFAAAKGMVERLRVTGVPDALPHVIGKAMDLVATSENGRREVYVFTDLTEAAWPEQSLRSLKAKLDEHPDVLLYIIDVGAESPRNVSLGELSLSSETLVRSSELVLQTEVRSQGMSGDVTVELLVEQPDPTRPVLVDGKPLLPTAQVRDRRTVTVSGSNAERVEFRVRGWDTGTQQGVLRMASNDGLPQDNVRYFTVDVRDAWPVLLVAPPQVNTSLMVEAISPLGQRETGGARFVCQEISQSDLANQNLSTFPIVCLLNPLPLTPAQWEQLEHHVEAGGGLVIFLGSNAQQTASFHEPAAQRVLGTKFARQWRTPARDLFLSPQKFDHPMLAVFRDQASSAPWQEFPVIRHWVAEELGANSSSIVNFSNGKPAMIERRLGKGRLLVAMTPFTEEARPAGRPAWNELLSGENPWPSFVLLNEMMRYLVSNGESRLNYQTGETATLLNDSNRDPERYQLFPPSEDPQEVAARDGQLFVAFTEQPGAYRLKGQRGGPVIRGFAVNLANDAGNLSRISPDRLQSILGEHRFRFARNRDEIDLEVGEARAGREFYPFLLIGIVIALGMEQALANRFYRARAEGGK